MAGHSKWANIKHRKGAQDAKRGKIFTKIIKEITVSAKIAGPDIDSNARLRKAIQKAKSNNVPLENIKRAIKKGSGSPQGIKFEEVVYEGYGPLGVAIMLEVITDNKNRSVAEIRHIFSKNGGKLAENGSVSWIFEKKGLIIIELIKPNEEFLYELALNAGAEDIEQSKNLYSIKISYSKVYEFGEILGKNGFNIVSIDIIMIPKTYQVIDSKEAEKLKQLFEMLEKNDDINMFYSNLKING